MGTDRALRGRCAARLRSPCFAHAGAAAATSSSPWPRPPRPSSRACSRTCCRRSRSRRRHRRARGRASAPARRSTWARRGDADVVFVHDQAAEEKFVAEGCGVKRYDVMYNDFVIVGPKADPAAREGQGRRRRARRRSRRRRRRSSRAATRAARRGRAALLEGGRHRHRRRRAPGTARRGSGMGPALNIASGDGRLRAHRSRHVALVQEPRRPGDRWSRATSALFNQYGVMLVNPAKHPHVKTGAGADVHRLAVSPARQQAIAAYRIDGQQLFFPEREARQL